MHVTPERAQVSCHPPGIERKQSGVSCEDDYSKAPEVNPSCSHLYGKPLKGRLLRFSMEGCAGVESVCRNMLEVQSGSLWMINSLIVQFRRQTSEEFDSSDVSKVIWGLSSSMMTQAKLISALVHYFLVRRRQLLVDLLPSYVIKSEKEALLSSPFSDDYVFR